MMLMMRRHECLPPPRGIWTSQTPKDIQSRSPPRLRLGPWRPGFRSPASLSTQGERAHRTVAQRVTSPVHGLPSCSEVASRPWRQYVETRPRGGGRRAPRRCAVLESRHLSRSQRERQKRKTKRTRAWVRTLTAASTPPMRKPTTGVTKACTDVPRRGDSIVCWVSRSRPQSNCSWLHPQGPHPEGLAPLVPCAPVLRGAPPGPAPALPKGPRGLRGSRGLIGSGRSSRLSQPSKER